MKKLALVMTFVFGVAMIAPAFAADPQKKAETKKECAATCKDAKVGTCCKAGTTDSKTGKACCEKPAADAATKTPEPKKK